MEISYFGLSAFKLRGSTATVVTDPYSPEVGWKLPKLAAEIVTVSHQHFDHNQVDRVEGTKLRSRPLIISAPGEYEAAGVAIYGYASWHDNNQGKERGKNVIYLLVIDGMRIVHLGDLGHDLSPRLVEELNGVDVLLVPVGGKYTIDVRQAVKIIEAIQPALVIPMHYKLPGLGETFLDLAEVDKFLEAVGGGEARRMDKLVMSRDQLPEQTEYVILSAKTS